MLATIQGDSPHVIYSNYDWLICERKRPEDVSSTGKFVVTFHFACNRHICFNGHENRAFYKKLINWSTEILFKENLSSNFSLIAVLLKVALEIRKWAQHCVLPRFTCFNVFRYRVSLLASSWIKVYKGHLQNKWVIKPSRKHPKSDKFVCIKSSLQFMRKL